MQAGDYSTAGVPDPIVRRVYVNGVHRHHVSDSWDAEIGSDLPEQVSAVSGIKARTGSVTFAPVATVVDTAPSPLQRADSWPPQRGDELTITDATGSQHWTRATARIVDVSAPLGDGVVEVSWSDDLDSALSQITELPPVAKRMPGEEVSESGVLKRHWHKTGLEPWAFVVESLEDAGFRLLPSIPDVDFYALFQGTTHPRIGRISQTYSAGDLLAWDTESGFQYLNQWSYFVPGYESREAGDCFTVYLRKTRGGPDAQTRWTMADGSELRLTLQNGSVALSHDGVVIAQRGFTGTSPLPWVGASIGYHSVTFWVEGQTVTITYPDRIPPGGIDWERVRVHGAAALAVNYVPRAGWPGFGWPSLRYRGWGESLVRETACARAVEPRTVRSLLDHIASSTLTGYWLDEHGTLQWAPSVRLEAQAPVETITTRLDVLSGAWTETGGGVASSVVTSYDEVALTMKSTIGVQVGDAASRKVLSGGDSDEEFAGPGADEEWLEPDMSPFPAGQNTPLMTRRAERSWWGGSYLAEEIFDDNTPPRPVPDSNIYQWANLPYGTNYLTVSVSELTPRQWKVSHEVASGAPQIQLITLPNSSVLDTEWKSYPLPIFRARGQALFASANVVYSRGPSWAPAYEHDLGAWGSRNDAHRIGDYLADRMSTIQVVLSQLSVVPDPRRQLGDVVEVNAQGVLGGVLRCLVVGIHEASDEQGITQELDLRVISATPSARKTYGDVEGRHANYASVEDSSGTYASAETI